MKSNHFYWTDDDFNVFTIDGLQNRMQALQTLVQPKFQELGRTFSAQLSAHGSGEFFPHVAKHARRTVNPPTDSWVAMAPSKRGYKALPHFQIGLWKTHLFIIIAVIYENHNKQVIAERLENKTGQLLKLPSSYIVSGDHKKPDAEHIHDIGEVGLTKLFARLHTVKKAEFLIGRHLSKEEATHMTKQQFFQFTEETIEQLLPIYDLIVHQH